MRKSWRFSVSGHDANLVTFEATGVTPLCEFANVFDAIMKETFHQLTKGRALYGAPGIGCRGPYAFKRFYFEEVEQ